MKQRVAAIIIGNKKVLMVTGYGSDLFWTPGGTMENGESQEVTLKRELLEELGVKLISMKPYLDYEPPKGETTYVSRSYSYLVNYEGKLKLNNEITEMIWYSKENFLNQNPRLVKAIETKLIPKLIEDNLI